MQTRGLIMGISIFEEKARRQHVITPSDTEPLPDNIIAIIVRDAGDISFTDRYNTTSVYSSIPAYTTFEQFTPLRINATNTTVTDIVAWSTA